jgi:hypothetical protein
MDRTGLLAEGIQAINEVGADIVSASGSKGVNDTGNIEVLFSADQETHALIRRYASRKLAEFCTEVYPIHCENPATVLVTVADDRDLEGAVTGVLAMLGCNIVQTFSGLSIRTFEKSICLDNSFAC